MRQTPVSHACPTCMSHIFWWDRQVRQVPVSHKTSTFMWDKRLSYLPVSHKTSGNKWDRRLSHLPVSHKTSGNKWDRCLSHTPVPLACRTYFGETDKWDRCISMWDRCLSHLFWAFVLLDFSGVSMIIFISQLKLTTLTSHIVLLMKNNNICNKNSLQFRTQMIKSLD